MKAKQESERERTLRIIEWLKKEKRNHATTLDQEYEV